MRRLSLTSDIDVLERRESAMWERLSELERRIEDINVTEASASVITPAINNFVRNGDGGFTQGGYASTSTFAEKEKVAAHWYTIQSDTSTYLTEHTAGTESSQSLKNSDHASYGTPQCDWDKATGLFRLGGGYSLVHPLTKNLATPGSRVYVQALVKLAPGVTVTSTHKIKAALFENIAGSTLRRIIEGTGFNLTLSPVGGTGATTRHYIVEIITTNGMSRSNSTSITNSVATLTPSQYVSISWQAHLGVTTIHIYRSEDGGATWKKITGTGLTGGTSFYDTGSAGVTASPPAASNQKAFATVDVSEGLNEDWQKVTFSIPVPPYYTMPTASDKQLLEIFVVDSSGAAVSTTNLGILVDKVGVGYNNGIWTPSPEDLATAATLQTTNPDPGAGGGTGGAGEPEDGGGTCIILDQPVLMADRTTKPARDVKIGDWVKVVHKGRLEDAEVDRVTYGESHGILQIETENSRSNNNAPHRLISQDKPLGTPSIQLTIGSSLTSAGYIDDKEIVVEDTVTSLKMETSVEPVLVVIFHVNHPSHNFVSGHLKGGIGGLVHHNLKPLD
jgi:hypothetical protein